MVKRNIRVYEREKIYPQSIAPYLELFKKSPDKYPYLANFWEVFTMQDDYLWWARDMGYIERSFRGWFDSWLKDETKRREIVGLYEGDHADIVKQFIEIKHLRIEGLNNEKLFEIYKRTIALALKHILYAEYTSDLFDDYFAVIFKESLPAELRGSIQPADLSELLQPATLTAPGQYRRRLLDLFFSGYTEEQAAELAEEYGWIRMSWDGANELKIADVMGELKLLKQESKDKLNAEYSELHNFTENVLRGRNELREKFDLKSKFWDNIFYLLDQFNLFHAYRKEIQMRSNQIIYKILREIPNRFDLPYDDLLFYYNEEVQALQNGKMVDNDVLSKRKRGITWVIQKGKVQEYLGEEARAVLEKEVLSLMPHAGKNQFAGLPASRGKATGRAFVTRSAQEANENIQAGEILVTPMTTVDYLPAMKRAGAVVTDDGGATCHAAVVSREFGIPCVVGTKFGTQTIKTGDMVEVDADSGVVKIIN